MLFKATHRPPLSDLVETEASRLKVAATLSKKPGADGYVATEIKSDQEGSPALPEKRLLRLEL